MIINNKYMQIKHCINDKKKSIKLFLRNNLLHATIDVKRRKYLKKLNRMDVVVI